MCVEFFQIVYNFRCIKSEKPFVCLDVEAGCDLNKNVIRKLNVSAVFTLSQDSDRLIKALKSPLLILEFDLWDRKVQLWKTGKVILRFSLIIFRQAN